MACTNGDPFIRERTIIDSLRLVNIHVIQDRVYYVYTNSLCVSGCVIRRFDSDIIASCICGSTIALVLDSGRLIVPLPETLIDPECDEICEEIVGMTSHKLFRRRVAATSSGKYIAINVSKTSILIYKFNGKTLTFGRSINVPKRGYFQITGDSVPYLWHLYANDDNYRIDVFEASELSPIKFPDEPIAKCPILPSQRKSTSFDESRCFLHACHTESLEGVLCYIDGSLIYLSLKSAIIGDLVSGLTRFPSTWLGSICTTQSATGTRTYICSQHDRKISQLISTLQGNNYEPLISESVGKIPFHMRFQKKVHFAVVSNSSSSSNGSSTITTANNSDVENTDSSSALGTLSFGNKIICESARAGKIIQFSVDARKIPRKVVILGPSTLEARTAATPVKTSTNKFGANNVQEAIYIDELQMLLLSCIDNDKTRCFINDVYNVSNDRAKIPTEIQFEFNNLISAGTIKNHTLALVGPEGIKLHTPVFPFNELASIPSPPGLVILDTSIDDVGIIVRSIDQVDLVSVEPGFPVTTLIKGLPTSFTRILNDTIYVGLDISFWNAKETLKNTFHSAIPSDHSYYDPENDTPSGAIIGFNGVSAEHEPVSITYHKYVPTGLHKPKHSNVNIIVYGHDGMVAHFNRMSRKLTLTSLDSRLKWVGVQSDDAVVIGTGLVIISDRGCQQLIDPSKAYKSPMISSATIINDEVIAYVSRHELKFVAGNHIGGDKPPSLLNQMQLPVVPSSVRLKMLLVPSQRLLLLHGENMCMFYDSITFEQILVTGITAVWCENILLWKFESNGEIFEHLVFADGRGWIESYSFRRDGPSLECSCKFRAPIFDHEIRLRSNELLYCRNNAIYVARGEYLTTIMPGLKTARFSTSFRHEVRCIGHAGPYLIVSTIKDIHVLEYDKLGHLARLSTSDLFLTCTDEEVSEDDAAVGNDALEYGNEDKEFSSHVAGCVISNNGANSIYILCTLECSKRKQTYSAILSYDIHTNTLSSLQPGRSRSYLKGIKSVQPDPEMSPDVSHATLKAFAAKSDHSISSIEIVPPQANGPEFKLLF